MFCRLATSGDGTLWGLNRKFGCAPDDAVRRVLSTARAAGLVPAGLSVHVGSQQMTGEAWQQALDTLAGTLTALAGRGIVPDHVNLGGGLPALGYLDRRGNPLDPPLDKIFTVLREGMERLNALAAAPLDFVLEPGRHLVADHGVIHAHVVRLTERTQPDGGRTRWLYLSAGKYNGLRIDQVTHPLVFPAGDERSTSPRSSPDPPATATTPTAAAGTRCACPVRPLRRPGPDPRRRRLRQQLHDPGVQRHPPAADRVHPRGRTPLMTGLIRGITEADWPQVAALEAGAYTDTSLTEGESGLRSRAPAGTSFVLDLDGRIAGYVLALPYPRLHCPDLSRPEQVAHHATNLHLHDLVVGAAAAPGPGHPSGRAPHGRRPRPRLRDHVAGRARRQGTLLAGQRLPPATRRACRPAARQRRGVHVGSGRRPAEGEPMTAPTAPTAPSFQRAKWSIAALFCFLGFQYGTWVSRLPALKTRLDLGAGEVGLLDGLRGRRGELLLPLVAVLMRRLGSRLLSLIFPPRP
ncbi:Diaminopimelate decarboxylase [Streptomyces canarius]